MREVLLSHFARYGQMTPQDAVKLVYQSAFGPGHLLADQERARAFLRRELEETPARAGAVLESIGGGYARLYLGAAKARGLADAEIYHRFSLAAAAPCPGKAAFEGAIACLEALAAQGEAPFSAAQLAEYLTAYRAEGCPMVSHSETYRAAYRPAYRVVLL